MQGSIRLPSTTEPQLNPKYEHIARTQRAAHNGGFKPAFKLQWLQASYAMQTHQNHLNTRTKVLTIHWDSSQMVMMLVVQRGQVETQA